MQLEASRWRMARAGLALAAGLAALLWPEESVEAFIHGAGLFLALDGALGLLAAASEPAGSDARRRRALEGGWSLLVALAVSTRPIFSILTLSFVLLLQLILWLAGRGMLHLGAWAAGDRRELPAGLLALAGALLLHLSPGAGAVDRRMALGALLLALAVAERIACVGRRPALDGEG